MLNFQCFIEFFATNSELAVIASEANIGPRRPRIKGKKNPDSNHHSNSESVIN